jgi:Ni/Co efflux regulator RcnB
MAATMATPLAAQRPRDRDGNERAARSEQRAERAEQRAEQRASRQAPQPRQAVEQRVEVRQAPQAQERSRGSWGEAQRSDRGTERGRQDWGRNRSEQAGETIQQRQTRERREVFRDRDAYQRHVEETRDASQRSAEGLNDHYQRQADRNQQRYERDLSQDRRQWQDRRGTANERRWGDRTDSNRTDQWRRGGGDDRRWSDRDGRRDRWDRNWRSDNRYDWQRYRYSNRNAFHIGRYYSPYRNHRYSRFSIGLFLGSAFFGDRYWINDPWQYRLPPAYEGTRWVRYYDDVLLVDLYTGEVIDVIYDFFW